MRIFLYTLLLPCYLLSQSLTSYYPEGSDGELEEYEQFSLRYNENREQADWVFYHLTREEVMLTAPLPRRPGFIKDRNISTGTPSTAAYTKTGFDRGHLSRAEFNYASEKAYRECFYMSNISPQLPKFNRAGQEWFDLELHELNLAEGYGEIMVATGPVFDDSRTFINSDVEIPDFFFKVIYVPAINKVMALLLPHDEVDGEFSDHQVSEEEVEQFTGFNFFPVLDKKSPR